MSDTKHEIDHISHSSQSGQHAEMRKLTTVTLTAEQFESLYLQPRIPSLSRGLGNPSALGVSAFLLAHMPLAMDLLNFQGATAASSVAMLGGFYACAGIGLYIACIMEWVMGNTFPSVVFGTFGGFWITYGFIVQPTLGIAASFAPASDAANGITAATAGMANPQYNIGLGMYFGVWGILNAMYFLGSLRTNVPFALVFFSLTFALEFIAAAYFHSAQGNLGAATQEFKIAGGFAFVTGLAGFWVDLHLILSAVDFPIRIPVFDLSGWGRKRAVAATGAGVAV